MSSGIMKKGTNRNIYQILISSSENVAKTVFFCRVFRNCTQLYNRNFTGKYLWRLYHSQILLYLHILVTQNDTF